MIREFHESLRYDYPDLTPASVVLDCGGFEGNFAKTINARYGCRVVVYEPILEFFIGTQMAVKRNPDISVMHSAVGASNRRENFGVKGDQTGVMCSGNRTENVLVMDIVLALTACLRDYKATQIALLKLNVEGMEFEVMERILDAGLADKIVHFQIQPHNIVPDAESRWQRIMDRLAETHEVDYYAPWVWFGATLRK